MSLKGYQWLDKEGYPVMSYRFKDLTIDIWKDTTKEELDKFKEFLKRNNCKHTGMNFHYHQVKGYLDEFKESE